MAKIPQITRNAIEPNIQQASISQSQMQGDQSVQRALTFVTNATQQYALDEKKKFDQARLTEAKNILDVQEARLSSDKDMGYQNKLGQNAVLFQDEDGKDFLQHYSDQYQKSIQDVTTQLKLTSDQQRIFNEYAQQKAVSFQGQLQNHQLRQGKEYIVSVHSSAIDVAKQKAQGQFTNFGEMDKTIEEMTSSVYALGAELGSSNAEIMRDISKHVDEIHAKNLEFMLESGDFMTSEAYLKQYGGKMSQLQKLSTENAIRKMKEDYVTAKFISLDTQAMTGGSNPAFNSSDVNEIKAIAQIDPVEFANLKYNDPRLDGLAVLKAREEGMDWAIPVVTAIRVAGEKSNNNQVSAANARGVYQFTPIAIKQVEQITGKRIDPNNPEEATWGALKFIDWISKKYNTQDPAIIASYFNGGGKYINQLKVGGAKAITNDENRNYVSRILAFDFDKYANNPVAKDGLNYDLGQFTPENQAKILSNREKVRTAEKKKEEERKKLIYENAMDMVILGQTSYEEIVANPAIVGAIDANQLKQIKTLSDAKKAEDIRPLLATIYSNPAYLKGKPQSLIDFIAENTTPAEAKGIAQLYAQANGRTIQDLKAADKAGSKSVVTHKLVFDVLKSYAPSIGFTGKVGTKKNEVNATSSAMFMGLKDEMLEYVQEVDQIFYNKNRRHMSEIEVRRVIRNELGKNNTVTSTNVFGSKTTEAVPRYRADVNRKQASENLNNRIMAYAEREGRRYESVDKIPDTIYWRYYYKALRR